MARIKRGTKKRKHHGVSQKGENFIGGKSEIKARFNTGRERGNHSSANGDVKSYKGRGNGSLAQPGERGKGSSSSSSPLSGEERTRRAKRKLWGGGGVLWIPKEAKESLA